MLSTLINPFQGLKRIEIWLDDRAITLSTLINPFQGLKRFSHILQSNSNTVKLSTLINPFQGLKRCCW